MKLKALSLLASLSLVLSTGFATTSSDNIKTLPKHYNCKRIEKSPFFLGGAPFLPQISGSHGPAVIYPWKIKEGKPDYNVVPIFLNDIIGFPNGHSMIVWPGAKATLECNLGSACLKQDDPTQVWQKGVIYSKNSTLTYCHIFNFRKRKKTKMHYAAMQMYEASWEPSKNKTYSCPETLYREVYQKEDLGVPVFFIDGGNIGNVNNLPPFPRSTWYCKGSKTQNFNASSYS